MYLSLSAICFSQPSVSSRAGLVPPRRALTARNCCAWGLTEVGMGGNGRAGISVMAGSSLGSDRGACPRPARRRPGCPRGTPEHPPVRAPVPQLAIGVAFDLPTSLVDEPMAGLALHHEVGEVGPALVAVPPLDVVRLEEQLRAAEAAASVPSLQELDLLPTRLARPAPEVEGVAGPVVGDGTQFAVARQPAGSLGGERAVVAGLGPPVVTRGHA